MAKEVKDLLDRYREDASGADVEDIRRNLPRMDRGPIAGIWDKVMTLLSFVTDPRKGWGSKAMAIVALVYLISPIDAVPDCTRRSESEPFAGQKLTHPRQSASGW